MAEKLLTLEQIIAVDDHRYQIEDVPEWGGKVKLRGMDTTTRTQYEAKMYRLTKSPKGLEDEDWQLLKIRVLAQCLYDANDNLLFDPKNEAQWKLLGKKSAIVIDRLFDLCTTLSGLGEKAEGE